MTDPVEHVRVHGVEIPLEPGLITDKIADRLRAGDYENKECAALAHALAPGDRVLDLGAGLGVTSTIAARATGTAEVVAVEGNPRLIPFLRRVHRLNGVSVDLRHGVAVVERVGEPRTFYLRRHLWGSSLRDDGQRYARAVAVPALDFAAMLAALRPTVLTCDIEGAEADLLPGADLSSLRVAIVELHPKRIGQEGVARVDQAFARAGLVRAEATSGERIAIYGRPGA